MERIVISGAGIVSTFGLGKGTFQENLTSNNVREIYSTEELITALQELRQQPPLNKYDFAAWRSMDQISKYALIASILALADAELDPEIVEPEERGIFFGTVFGCLESNVLFNHKLLTTAPRYVSRTTFSNTVSNAAVGQIALLLQARGMQITTASGGAYPIIYAIQQLRANRVKVALTGGMERLVPLALEGLQEVGLLSQDVTKPFAPECSGFVAHEGAGALVLEKLTDCQKRGRTALAEVVSYGVGNDFNLSMRESLERAELDAGAIDIVVPQANGTKWDALEAAAIESIFAIANSRPRLYPVKELLGEHFAAGTVLSIVAVLTQIAPNRLAMINTAAFDSRSKATFIIRKYFGEEEC